MATNQADSDYPAMRERPPVDPHTYRDTLPPPYPDNQEAAQQYNDFNQFLARLKAIFENDHPAIHARLEQVAQVLRELEQVAQSLEDMYVLIPEVENIALSLASQMRESITWGRAMLDAARNRITNVVQVLKIDAIPEAKQRPGRSQGGKMRSKNIRETRHAKWQKDAESLVNDVPSGKHKKTSTSVYNIAHLLADKYKREQDEANRAACSTIRKFIHKTW